MEKTLKNIKEILTWYHKSSGNQEVNDFLDRRDKLAIWSFRLAELAADLKIDYNAKYFIRKINVAKNKQAYINEKKSATEAENLATLDFQEVWDEMIQAEAEAYRADVLLRQVNKVLEAMNQRIAFMKTEKINSQKI